MIAFLISLAPFIPVILQLVGLLIQWFGTSKENLAAYQAMIEKNKDAGKITVETAQALQDLHAKLLARYELKHTSDQAKPKG